MKAKFFIFFLALIFGFSISDCLAEEDLTVTVPDRKGSVSFQILEKDSLIVSVKDLDDNPIRGLKDDNFIVMKGTKKAKILSVESLETSQEVGLNYVLVIDNSFSMKNREAIGPLLSALEEVLKILRPIDNVQVVVFDEKDILKIDERTLHLRTLNSNDQFELRQFIRDSFKKRLSSRTFLYEAMFAGAYFIKKLPEKSNKYLVIFSDGEDINSNLNQKVVEAEIKGAKNTEVHAIDYMPTEDPNPFLKSFSNNNKGRIWKARSADNLIPIFNAVSSTMLYRYIVKYRFLNPPVGTLEMQPSLLSFEMITGVEGSPLSHVVFFERGRSDIPGGYNLYRSNTEFNDFNRQQLKTVQERYKNVLNIVGQQLLQNKEAMLRITGCNADMGVEKNNTELSRKRAENVKNYLVSVCGVDSSRIYLNERNLPLKPSPADRLGGSFENQRVEILFNSPEMQAKVADDFLMETGNTSEIIITPKIVTEYGLSEWELDIFGGDKTIKTLKGTDDLQTLYTIPLSELGVSRLINLASLKAGIRVKDADNNVFETTAPQCAISVTKTIAVHEFIPPLQASLVLEPDNITVEEVTTIDSSPLLNYVFFETGESKIPDRYILFKNQSETNEFKESFLKVTMSKYSNIINIFGERLRKFPGAKVKLVGCNSDYGKEKGRRDLSLRRAEEVKAYLKYIWGIDQARIEVEARNLPAFASTSRVEEARVENQRVEITSDMPEILDTSTTTYVVEISDAELIKIKPIVEPGYGIEKWSLKIKADEEHIASLEGNGEPFIEHNIDLKEIGLNKLGSRNNINVQLVITDVKGQTFETEKAEASIKYIRREERVAQKMGYRVVEKYALILFDFNSDTVKERNKAVLDRVIERINQFPSAKVTIVGHTDIIGKEEYNVNLSKRRAKTVYDQILKSNVVNPERISHDGFGPHEAPYENSLPEGRSFNRTVTILLEYEQKE